MPLIGELVDDFADGVVDPVRWANSYGSVAETGGRARVSAAVGAWSAFSSARVWTLAGSVVQARLWPPDPGGATDTAYVSFLITSSVAGTDAGVLIDVVSNGSGAFIGLFSRTGFSDPNAVFLPYDATEHAWVQVAEAGGTLNISTSPDGVHWTSRYTAATPAWAADVNLGLVVEAHRGSGADDFAWFDSLNTPAAVLAAGLPPPTAEASATASVGGPGLAAQLPTVAAQIAATATAGGGLSAGLPAVQAAVSGRGTARGVLQAQLPALNPVVMLGPLSGTASPVTVAGTATPLTVDGAAAVWSLDGAASKG